MIGWFCRDVIGCETQVTGSGSVSVSSDEVVVVVVLRKNTVKTSEDDGSRTYTSLVKSTEEDSDIEYENQISAPEYVNA
ncbi:hypothetical protein AWC38_SpisGene23507 [Stylophora pistillata]|uniref:Uncharacterized protein n=1 Tax=Stylophora pistillata TaxID=50429 RepID=A0A2B4R4H5_STYPI|nr:hypothetical protein AWC38_SpisGene23507 [Stylophora pistillata]